MAVDQLLRAARDALLRRILMSMKYESVRLPAPDQFLELVDERRVVMIDPLATPEMA